MGDELNREGVIEAARVMRAYLPALVGPAAASLDEKIAGLLAAAASGRDVSAEMQTLLMDDGATADFLAEVLTDVPACRPPELQPADRRTRGVGLSGDVAPVMHSGRFACPHGDFVWYRPDVGTPLAHCPTHGPVLQAT